MIHKSDFSNITPTSRKLVVTGKDPTPVEINVNTGLVIRREDMSSTHEEADTLIIFQVAYVGANTSVIIADDTDVFVLLLHFQHFNYIRGKIIMESPVKDRAVIDMNATVDRHRDIIPELLATHGLTGCDTVASYFGIGKPTALIVLRTHQHSLSMLGNITLSVDEVMTQATSFILSCYGKSECSSLTEARQQVWASKVSKNLACAPQLHSLPPTNEAFKQNVARAHLQVAIWRESLTSDQPSLDPTQYGYTGDGQSLLPSTLPADVLPAPNELLKLIKCNKCSGDTPCKTKRCSCHRDRLGCSMFCGCRGETCFNEYTVVNDDQSEEDDG